MPGNPVGLAIVVMRDQPHVGLAIAIQSTEVKDADALAAALPTAVDAVAQQMAAVQNGMLLVSDATTSDTAGRA